MLNATEHAGTRLPALGSRLKKQTAVPGRKKPGGLLHHTSKDEDSSDDEDEEQVPAPKASISLPSIATTRSSASLSAVGGAASPTAAQSAKSRTGSPAHARGSSGSPLAAAAADDVLATTRLGITLRGLRKIAALLRAQFGEAFEDMSTADVNMRYVELVTERRRCRLVELAEVVAPADVSPPLYFISHCWKNRAARLFGHVLDYLQSASEEVAVW
ncbi:hypothetical protein HXX76_010698 [Chlamydomonas incerta]|uniref:Uncharacterized protein n=1 Tax=Chlamydomonas incerta TaxID=51695 RepID=A0A835SUC1_CHLIN|nr:hypothetical protein HXX76_010698 [Chlamydomonas incerta]|eukprot:KAG2429918.1 hypothetical protein HXX76_010698 [Chlamydomonas incerta]